MACMKLGSKSEVFQRDGQTWNCTAGLPSDVTIEIGEMSFHLHKFPLLSRSGKLEKLIGEFPSDSGSACVLQLHDLPGGPKAFELVAKFCYGVKMDLTALNVVSLRCAAEDLQMTEDYSEGNLIAQTEGFLNVVFNNWTDAIKALKTCEEVLPYAEELNIVPRCINSLALKACANQNLFNWPVSGCNNMQSIVGTVLWNGLSTATRPQSMSDDWWYEDVAFLGLPLYKRMIQAVQLAGMKPENIAGSITFYAKRHLPLINRQMGFNETNHVIPGPTIFAPSEADQRALLEEIVELLPNQKGVTETRFLLLLLHAAINLNASPLCRENLEKRVGAQLDQASLEDLLIPNMDLSVETLYDIDCFQRILEHFMSLVEEAAAAFSPCIVEEGQLMERNQSLTSITMVANLVDAYLADVASDAKLKFTKFQSLAAAIPDYARPLADGIYRAIDIYLKAHPWLTDSEREQICRLMNCQKLSLEASTHAAQNERLPLRVIVQVLFFEQLRLRTSIAGWFFISENRGNSHNPNQNLALSKNDDPHQEDHPQDRTVGTVDMTERVTELEKECESMKLELQKLVKMKRKWNIFRRRKPQQCSSKESKPCSLKTPVSSLNPLSSLNLPQHQGNGKLGS